MMASQKLLKCQSVLTSISRNSRLAFARCIQTSAGRSHSPDDQAGSKKISDNKKDNDKVFRKAKTPVGRLDDEWEGKREKMEPQLKQAKTPGTDPYAAFPGGKNPATGEIGGPRGPEPTRYGDWERKGRVIDF